MASDKKEQVLVIEDSPFIAPHLVDRASRQGIPLEILRRCDRTIACHHCDRFVVPQGKGGIHALDSLFQGKEEGIGKGAGGSPCDLMVVRNFTEASQFLGTDYNNGNFSIGVIFVAVSFFNLSKEMLLPIRKNSLIDAQFSGDEALAIQHFRKWQGLYLIQMIRKFFGSRQVYLVGSLDELRDPDLEGLFGEMKESPLFAHLKELPENVHFLKNIIQGGMVPAETNPGHDENLLWPEKQLKRLQLLCVGSQPIWFTGREGDGRGSVTAFVHHGRATGGSPVFVFKPEGFPPGNHHEMLFGEVERGIQGLVARGENGTLSIWDPWRLDKFVQREIAAFLNRHHWVSSSGQLHKSRLKVVFHCDRDPEELLKEKLIHKDLAEIFDPLCVLRIPRIEEYKNLVPELLISLVRRSVFDGSVIQLLDYVATQLSTTPFGDPMKVQYTPGPSAPPTRGLLILVDPELSTYVLNGDDSLTLAELILTLRQTLFSKISLVALGKTQLVNRTLQLGVDDVRGYLQRIISLGVGN